MRSTAKAGTSTLPPRPIVRRTVVGQPLRVGHRVRPVAVRRLHHDRVGGRRVRGRAEQRVVPAAEVAAEEDPVPVDGQRDRRRAEDVPGGAQPQRDPAGDRHVLVERDRLEQRQRALDVVGVVQREGGSVLGEAGLVGVRRVLLLEVGAVAQHDRRELGGLGRAPDRPAEALLDQPREVAGVVEVRVGEHDLVDGGGVHGELVPVAPPQRGRALVEPGVDQHPGARALHEEAAAGDGARGAEEGEGGLDHVVHSRTRTAARK